MNCIVRHHPARRRTTCRWLTSVCALAISWLAPLTTNAEPSKAELTRAEAKSTEARAYYQSALYKEAAQSFMDAFAITKRPRLLYAAASAREKAGQRRRAYALYSMYLELPDIPVKNRAYAESKIIKLDSDIQASPNNPSVSKDGASRGFPVWQASVGGALVIGGAVSWLVARSIAADLSADQLGETVSNQADADAHRANATSARRWQGVAVGSAVIGAGFVVWSGWLWQRRRSKDTAWRMSPSLSTDRVGWTLTGSF